MVFDPEEELQRLAAEFPLRSRRMAFSELCAAYACFRLGEPQWAVAKAFGIALGTMSLLARCDKEGAIRYRRVAIHWHDLGRPAFLRYVTPEHLARLRVVRAEGPQWKSLRMAAAVDEGANKWAKTPFELLTHDCRHRLTYCIVFRSVDGTPEIDENGEETGRLWPAGWTYRAATEEETLDWRIYPQLADDPKCVDMRVRTSGVALDRCIAHHGLAPWNNDEKLAAFERPE